MESRINNLQAGLWFGFTCLLAGALAVNAVQALFGYAELATWQWPVLAISTYLTWESMPARQITRLAALCRLMKIKAAKAMSFPLSSITRAVRGLAALFSTSGNRPQTEP